MQKTSHRMFPTAIQPTKLFKFATLLLALCLFANTARAQLFASCTHRAYYIYNNVTEELEFLNGYDEYSMFKINRNLTMFEHTTPEISSSYFVSESEYDEDQNTPQWMSYPMSGTIIFTSST